MLARKYSLKGKKEFLKVEKEGRLYQYESFGLAVLDSGKDVPPKFAFVVSTKVSKEAVHRNRVKRALSEAVRVLAGYVKRGLKVVFLAKGVSIKKSTDALMREVQTAFKKSELLEKSK